MSLTRLALRFAAPLPRIEEFKRCLFIGPHPDDIEIGAGATAAKLAAAGKELCFLICTDGRFGDAHLTPGQSAEELIALRQEEARRSAALLGVSDVRFLNLSDGGLYGIEELRRGMAGVIGDFEPDIIFAPDPRVTSECHADHLNGGESAMRLAYFAPYAGIMAGCGAKSAPVKALALYMTAKPNQYVKTTGYLDRQLAAVFSCHKSQFPDGCAEAKAISLYLKLRSADHGLRSLKGAAEGFRVLGVTQMHCLPEAGEV